MQNFFMTSVPVLKDDDVPLSSPSNFSSLASSLIRFRSSLTFLSLSLTWVYCCGSTSSILTTFWVLLLFFFFLFAAALEINSDTNSFIPSLNCSKSYESFPTTFNPSCAILNDNLVFCCIVGIFCFEAGCSVCCEVCVDVLCQVEWVESSQKSSFSYAVPWVWVLPNFSRQRFCSQDWWLMARFTK